MPKTPDAIDDLCSFLRSEAGLSEDQMSRIDVMITAIIAQSTGQSYAEIAANAALRGRSEHRHYLERYPDSQRLG
jgi:hypothetical protein